MHLRAITATIMLFLLVASGLSAHTASNTDPNDTPGRFDILRTTLKHPDKLVLETEVAGNIRKADFRGRENVFLWSLDTTGDDDFDYYVFLDTLRRDGRVRYKCMVLRNKERVAVLPAIVDGDTGICRVRLPLVDGLPETWNMYTELGGNGDAAPDVGRFVHGIT